MNIEASGPREYIEINTLINRQQTGVDLNCDKKARQWNVFEDKNSLEIKREYKIATFGDCLLGQMGFIE